MKLLFVFERLGLAREGSVLTAQNLENIDLYGVNLVGVRNFLFLEVSYVING